MRIRRDHYESDDDDDDSDSDCDTKKRKKQQPKPLQAKKETKRRGRGRGGYEDDEDEDWEPPERVARNPEEERKQEQEVPLLDLSTAVVPVQMFATTSSSSVGVWGGGGGCQTPPLPFFGAFEEGGGGGVAAIGCGEYGNMTLAHRFEGDGSGVNFNDFDIATTAEFPDDLSLRLFCGSMSDSAAMPLPRGDEGAGHL